MLRERKKQFQIMPHTADVKIRAWGKNYPELFKNAMLGMMQILSPLATKFEIKNQKSKIKIKVESQNINSLLIDFLNEVLYQTQVNREIYTNIKFLEFSKNKLVAQLLGSRRAKFSKDIKAVTYHGEGIKKTAEGFKVIVLFDI